MIVFISNHHFIYFDQGLDATPYQKKLKLVIEQHFLPLSSIITQDKIHQIFSLSAILLLFSISLLFLIYRWSS